MKIIIAGSRTIREAAALMYLAGPENLGLFKALAVTEIVSGCCRGVDTAGEKFAIRNGLGVKRFPADWKKHGKSAGPIRNTQMAEYADGLFLIWDGMSRGSRNMKETMWKMNKPIIRELIV